MDSLIIRHLAVCGTSRLLIHILCPLFLPLSFLNLDFYELLIEADKEAFNVGVGFCFFLGLRTSEPVRQSNQAG